LKPQWEQELLWVKRNEAGVIIGISDKPPSSEDFIPTIPTGKKEKEPSHMTTA
jgi:hypothetical protein